MKSLINIFAFIFLFATSASAQVHSLQLNNGPNVAIIQAAAAGGAQTYLLPPVGGTLLTTGSIPSVAWVLVGNTLTGVLPGSPTEWFGSVNAADLIFKTTSIEQM